MLKANKKLTISQSIIWASAIFVVAIVEEKQFATFFTCYTSNSVINKFK